MEGFNGSYMFESISLYIEIPLDQVNFIMVQIFGILFGNIFRLSLPCNKIGPEGRHLVEFLIGFSMLFFCFGSKAFILLFQTALGYLLILIIPQSCGIICLISSMAVLSLCHWNRLYFDPTSYITVDITGPLMINTQRITSLAFGISDGWKQKKDKHTKADENKEYVNTNKENDNRMHEHNGIYNRPKYLNSNSNDALKSQAINHVNNYNDNHESKFNNGRVYKSVNGHLINGSLNKDNLITNKICHLHEIKVATDNNHCIENKVNVIEEKNNEGNSKDCLENQFIINKTINHVPSVLELLGYTYCFHTVICGPFCFYHEYVDFIEEKNSHKKSDGTVNTTFSFRQLDPKWNILSSLCSAFFLIILALLFTPSFNMTSLANEAFNRSMEPLKICLYLLVISHIAKFKYYVAWKLADAMNSSVGLNFNGWDEKGRQKWDLTKNVDVLKVETATNLQMVFRHWNKTTSSWLRYTVYERTKSTYLVFTLSAMWHGFFSGYYISFISGAFFISVSKMARKLIRPFFVSNAHSSSLLYDVLTIAITKIQMAYLGSAFMLLDFRKSFKFYSEIYFIIHIINVLVFLLLLFLTKRMKNKLT